MKDKRLKMMNVSKFWFIRDPNYLYVKIKERMTICYLDVKSSHIKIVITDMQMK